MDLENICHQTIALVKKTGKFIQKERENFDTSRIEFKGSHSNMVSYVDKEAEKILVKGLKMLVPEAGFITEEETETIKGEKYNWIIDPLDGTTNFLHNVPLYCVSVALECKGKVIVGVIYSVVNDECFYSWKGGGAFLNNKRITVSKAKSIEESLIATGFPYQLFDKFDNYMLIIKDFVEHTHGLRRLGAAALDLAYVACGRFEGYFEFSIKPWDIAAGILLVKEAGGVVTDFKGGDDVLFCGEIVAGAKMQPEMLHTITKKWNL